MQERRLAHTALSCVSRTKRLPASLGASLDLEFPNRNVPNDTGRCGNPTCKLRVVLPEPRLPSHRRLPSTPAPAHEALPRRRVEGAHQQLHVLLHLARPRQPVREALDGHVVERQQPREGDAVGAAQLRLVRLLQLGLRGAQEGAACGAGGGAATSGGQAVTVRTKSAASACETWDRT